MRMCYFGKHVQNECELLSIIQNDEMAILNLVAHVPQREWSSHFEPNRFMPMGLIWRQMITIIFKSGPKWKQAEAFELSSQHPV